MIGAIVTFGMIIVFFISGHILEVIKRLIMLFIDIVLKVLNMFGLHVSRTEKKLRMSKEFKLTYKEITIVRRSKENKKLEKSINIPALVTVLVMLTLIIVNSVWDGCITVWLWQHNPLPQLITSYDSLEITSTAVVFSFMSFGISKLVSLWKATANYRAAKKQIRLRRELLHTMSSKELLDTLKEKDNEIYLRLKADKDHD